MPEIKVPFFSFPLAFDSIRAEIDSAISRVLDHGIYFFGAETQLFEEEFAAYTNSKYCLTVANGTDALEIALRSIGIIDSDTVLICGNAGGYSMTALNNIGASYSFLDVNEDNLTLDLNELTSERLKEAKALILTHIYGNIAEVEAIVRLCNKYDVKVIEDCSQAHGARIAGRHVGSFGDCGVFSFYPTKNLGALGDAAAITTSDKKIADTIRLVRQYGWREKYIAEKVIARNSRIDEIQATILRVKLKYLNNHNNQRLKIAQTYRDELKNLPIQFQCLESQTSVYHLFVIRTNLRNRLRKFLEQKNITTLVHYPLPDYCQENSFNKRSKEVQYFPNTNLACETVLSLPLYPNQPENQISKVIENIALFMSGNQ